ncbi:MAG: TIGR04282 family arsenosugar biosynthesis glycosyltransferase [Candidatus Thermoplasmatota archaeon]|nr:TIGR04282 family arsenosugar biosynthesis glycosyltransferase [Candidatus Thermoplasmatota archaeon]
MSDAVIILMARAPVKGSVKKRLAVSIGEDAALEVHRNSVSDILLSLSNVNADIMIGFHPAEELRSMIDWLGEDLEFIPQAGSDLGERQASLLGQAFSMGYDKAAVMISDSPDIPPEYIRKAFTSLDDAHAVLGPCHDGGYYLIGFRKCHFRPLLFGGVEWGGRSVGRIMSERIKGSGLVLVDLPPWWDMDIYEDLVGFWRRSLAGGSRGRTFSYIERSGVLDER